MTFFDNLWDQIEYAADPLFRHYRSRLDLLAVEEKSDRTLLTEVDVRVQDEIAQILLDLDPQAQIIAEEISPLIPQRTPYKHLGRSWIIDPIDGTSQFVSASSVEFCSVICLVEDAVPIAALIYAPEIGPGRSAVSIRVDGPGAVITVNGLPAVTGYANAATEASVTRDARAVGARPLEIELERTGWNLKKKTTSQSLDMARTAIDLGSATNGNLSRFGLFYRENQKLWDGAAGICLARAAGLHVADSNGNRLPFISVLPKKKEPIIASTLVASDKILSSIFPDIDSALRCDGGA